MLDRDCSEDRQALRVMRTIARGGDQPPWCERVALIEPQYPRSSRLNQPVMPVSRWT